MNRYFNNFTNLDDIINAFEIKEPWFSKLKEAEILLASYGGRAYEGDALVIFSLDGKLYEVHGGHCSCNGLEGQWDPEETSVQAIAFRFKSSTEDEDNLFNALASLSEEHGPEMVEAMRQFLMNWEFEEKVLSCV